MKSSKPAVLRIDAQRPDSLMGTSRAGDFKFAHVVSIEGGQAIAAFDTRVRMGGAAEERVVIGATVSIETPRSSVIGVVTGLSVPTAELEQDQAVLRLFEVDLVGEVRTVQATGEKRFHRGVTTLPTLGDPVGLTGADSLAAVYSSQGRPSIEIGTLAQDSNVAASVLVDELLSKHFAIVGSTGAGKSCGIAGLLHGLVNKFPGSRIIVLDIHNEYAAAFNG
ncbi:MAG: helicase HerA domain-containing protein, partial [Phycisphaerae bacterium]